MDLQVQSHVVVDGMAQLLFTAKVPFCRLYRRVSQQKLDLFQFAAGEVAQSRAGPAIMPHAA